jgi:hypothetical protein
MDKVLPDSILVACPTCSGIDFEIRALKEEGLATTRCAACGNNYLLLDSEDYWFDVIQRSYPRLKRCSCKSTQFSLRCNYEYREGGDVRSIEIIATCSACAADRHLLNLDIDYSDTENLVRRPLRYCKNPKILYDVREMHLYATRNDIARAIAFLASDFHCSFACWVRENDQWVMRQLIAKEAQAVVLADEQTRYLRVYATKGKLDVPADEVGTSRDENAFWKRNEVIRISSPTHMMLSGKLGLLFYISFSNEHVQDEKIVRKSEDFVAMTGALTAWLKTQFVSWRGPCSFDNRDEHIRLFSDRFTKNG